MRIKTGTTLAEIAEFRTDRGEAQVLQALGSGAFLLVFPWQEEGEGAFDTSMMDQDELRLDDAPDPGETLLPDDTDLGALTGGDGGLSGLRPEAAYLVPLVKSDRNPFERLITLGRARNNDVILLSSGVSKVHAWFSTEGPTGWVFQDNGSTNGTTHNDRLVPPKTNLPLRFGDTLGFAGVQALFADGPTVLELAQRRCSAS